MSQVQLNDHILSWDAVEGAHHYSVKVMLNQHDGYEVPVMDTKYALTLYKEGEYTLYVRAVFEDGSYSDYSPAILYTVQEEVAVTPGGEDGKVMLRGTGSYEDPLLIYTREELETLVKTDGTREETANGETKSVRNYYRLMQDIDLSDKEWTSIGSSQQRFEGYFDGNGHTIKGLTQTELDHKTSRYNAGLFAELGAATIINLNLTDIDISIGLINDEFRIGGIAGYSVGATIENCSVSGTIKVDSAQSSQKTAYVGMLIGYTNGAAMRRITVSGDIDVTFAKVYSGGLAGICTSSPNDVIRDVLSYVNVKAHGTARSSNQPAGRAYAAGIAYLSTNVEVNGVVWLGTARATAIPGTPADEEMYAEGMFVAGGNKIVNHNECQIPVSRCFFDINGLPYDQAQYAESDFADKSLWLSAVAKRYAVGNARSQKSTSTVFAVDSATKGEQERYMPTYGDMYFGLDFDTTWTMTGDQAKPLALQAYHSQWFTVTFLSDDGKVVSTQHVLKGQTATQPVYKGEEGYAVQWDLDANTPIESDMTVHILHAEE
jgi:hypothetical protein